MTTSAVIRSGVTLDADALAQIQHDAWMASYSDLLPAELMSAVDEATMADRWRASLEAAEPASVLVAAERTRPPTMIAPGDDQAEVSGPDSPVGFAALGPPTDADAEPTDIELLSVSVAPGHRGVGHGSRLLTAAVDVAAQRGAKRAYAWLPVADKTGGDFLVSAGWAPDGARRTLDLRGDGAVLVEEIRLHSDISAA